MYLVAIYCCNDVPSSEYSSVETSLPGLENRTEKEMPAIDRRREEIQFVPGTTYKYITMHVGWSPKPQLVGQQTGWIFHVLATQINLSNTKVMASRSAKDLSAHDRDSSRCALHILFQSILWLFVGWVSAKNRCITLISENHLGIAPLFLYLVRSSHQHHARDILVIKRNLLRESMVSSLFRAATHASTLCRGAGPGC